MSDLNGALDNPRGLGFRVYLEAGGVNLYNNASHARLHNLGGLNR